MSMSTEDIARFQEYAKRQSALMSEILEENPNLPTITAIIMASDKVSAENSAKRLEEGVPFARAVAMVGSYSRLEFALTHAIKDQRYRWLISHLPALWSGSDPDDTDSRFLTLWRDAWRRNDRAAILDGPRLPDGKVLMVYRGQREGEKLGIAWSLDRDIAEKFALGASFRTPILGSVIERQVKRKQVLAYLTKRGESEVIIDIGA